MEITSSEQQANEKKKQHTRFMGKHTACRYSRKERKGKQPLARIVIIVISGDLVNYCLHTFETIPCSRIIQTALWWQPCLLVSGCMVSSFSPRVIWDQCIQAILSLLCLLVMESGVGMETLSSKTPFSRLHLPNSKDPAWPAPFQKSFEGDSDEHAWNPC